MADAPVVAVFGATALGKTEVAVALAERIGGEIVVADSMQIYAGLPILTNQPNEEQRSRARHHLVGFVPPQREYTVAEYAQEAQAAIDRLRSRGRPVILEGGSGLYLRSALGGLEFWSGAAEPQLRGELERRWSQGPPEVLEELRRIDPGTYARVDRSNPRRVIRALEAVHSAGGPLPAADRDLLWEPAERYRHLLVGLTPDGDREALRQAIDARVDGMVAAGALQEVAAARGAGPLSRTAVQAIGVRELSACLDGEMTLPEAIAAMKRRTRALVRRQLTWLRKTPTDIVVAMSGDSESAARVIHDLIETRAW
jgi:tRNA dimethylallyltransferase